MKQKMLQLFGTVIITIMLISTMAIAQTNGVLYSLNGSAQTISKIDLKTKEITKDLLATGSVPNRIYTYEGMLYVVNSTPENVMVIDPNNDTEVKTTIAIEEGSNPWAMAFVSNEKAYVTGLKADLVYVVDLISGTVTKSIPVGKAPEGIIVKDGKAYVANTGYVAYGTPYEQATVSVIDVTTDKVVASVNVPTNAQDLAFAPNGSLHVVCTGDYTTTSGAVAVIDVTLETPAAIDTVIIGGSPGDIEISSEGYGYLSAWGDGTNGFLYKYDANTYEAINNNTNPILVGPNFSGITYMSKEDVLWLPYMTEWGGDGFAQLFDPSADVVNWTSRVIGNGASDFAYLSDKYTSVEELTSNIADEYNLSQNYPNPFNPTTTIEFSVPKQAAVSMKVFNVLGQQVSELINKEMTAGSYKVSFDASKLTSGVYFYTIQAGNYKATKKMILLK